MVLTARALTRPDEEGPENERIVRVLSKAVGKAAQKGGADKVAQRVRGQDFIAGFGRAGQFLHRFRASGAAPARITPQAAGFYLEI